MHRFLAYFICVTLFICLCENTETDIQPYLNLQSSDDLSKLNTISHCPHKINGTEKHQIFHPHLNISSTLSLKSFISYLGRSTTGHIVHVPLSIYKVTVVEPGGRPGGCKDLIKSTVRFTAEGYGDCEIAMNAALFHKKIPCLGNLIIDGKRVRDSYGVQNAHFGIFKNGSLFFGYLSEHEFLKDKFRTLVGGVIWLVNNGKPFVDESLSYECAETEETGSLQRFVNVRSARTAVGHDSYGNVVFVHVDGKTDKSGVNLREFSQLLINMGIVNAVNFDGGGSATFVVNGTVVNYPSDECIDNPQFSCEREVGTIFCVTKSRSTGTNSQRISDESLKYRNMQVLYLCIFFVLLLTSVVCIIILIRKHYAKKKYSENGDADVHYSLLNHIGNQEILLASGVPSELGSDTEVNR